MLSAYALLLSFQTAVPIADNAEVEARALKVDEMMKAPHPDWPKVQSELNASRIFIHTQIADDRLKTAKDFARAFTLSDDPRGWSGNRILQHELALCGLALGEENSPARFRQSWDMVQQSLGRKQRFGFFKRPTPESKVPVVFNLDPDRPAAAVLLTFEKLTAAKAQAGRAKNSAEMEAIRKADQDERQREWKPEEMEAIMLRDAKRLRRTKELLKKGLLHTGRDLHSASLLLQHGDDPDDYGAAHELAVAAFLLGDTEAKWLISRTYDRYLLSLGHPQRLGTQYWPGTAEGLAPMDEKNVNDTIRTTLGAVTLEKTREIGKGYATG